MCNVKKLNMGNVKKLNMGNVKKKICVMLKK